MMENLTSPERITVLCYNLGEMRKLYAIFPEERLPPRKFLGIITADYVMKTTKISAHSIGSSNSNKYKITENTIEQGPPKVPTPQIHSTTIHDSTCTDCHKDLNCTLLAVTACNHSFHISCMLNLLLKTDRCPSCCQQISTKTGWTVHHIPCSKTFDKSELLWNDAHHLWMHKDCRFSVIEVRHLTHPEFMRSVDNSFGSSNSATVNSGVHSKSRTDSPRTYRENMLEQEWDSPRTCRQNMLEQEWDSSGTSAETRFRPKSNAMIPEVDNFDKISKSHNAFDLNFFDEALTIEHQTLFETATDEFDFKSEKSEETGNRDEDICKICDERFDLSHQPTTVTICGHLLHTHCMNSYLPTAKKCPICKHDINWVDVTNKCVFCLQPFNWNGDMCVPLPCAHESHHNCHKLWMFTTNDCPICKETIYSRDGCSVCSKPILPSQIKRVSPCKHEYHAKCSVYQITESNCPKCIKIRNAASTVCSICLEQIIKDVKSKTLSCKHEFHSTCLGLWMEHKTNCPLCRKNIDSFLGADLK